jgi:cation diffusion facilitator family transporter
VSDNNPTPQRPPLRGEPARAGAELVARGIALNALMAAAKIAGGVLGNTYALIADGVESLLDIFSSALVWAGLRVASRPPDENHPYGHGKAESLAGLLVALFVLLAAGWIGWHAVKEIVTPHRGPHWGTLPLLAVIIAVKFAFSRRLVRAGREAGSTALGIEAWHHYADALTSAAAFIGIGIGVAGGKGYESADDWAALVACVVVAWNGVSLARRALDDVMDVAVPRAFEEQIRLVAAAVPGVRGLEKCRIRKSGLHHLVEIHVEVDGTLSVHAGHEIARAVKRALLASPHRVGDVVVHIEPAGETGLMSPP